MISSSIQTVRIKVLGLITQPQRKRREKVFDLWQTVSFDPQDQGHIVFTSEFVRQLQLIFAIDLTTFLVVKR